MKKSEFATVATTIPASINGQTLMAYPKQSEKGSSGWYANGRVTLTLPNGEVVQAQVGCNITVIKSKEWAD